MNPNFIFIIGAAVLAMLYSFWKTGWINKQDEGTERMKSIGSSIADGAMAFLKAEYRVLSIFVIAVAVLLGFANAGRADSSALISLSFIVGAITSGLAGFLGMKVATKANNRTTNAAQESLGKALEIGGNHFNQLSVEMKNQQALEEARAYSTKERIAGQAFTKTMEQERQEYQTAASELANDRSIEAATTAYERNVGMNETRRREELEDAGTLAGQVDAEHTILWETLPASVKSAYALEAGFTEEEIAAGHFVYFAGADKVRFRRPVVPGDELRCEVEVLRVRRKSCQVHARATVDGELAAEATLFSVLVEVPEMGGE